VRPKIRPKGFETTTSTEGGVHASQVEEQTAQAIADSLRPLKDQLDAEGYEVEITARRGSRGEGSSSSSTRNPWIS
jgi:hypothetical protein